VLVCLIILGVLAVPSTYFGWRSFRRLLAESGWPAMMPDTVLEASFRGGLASAYVHASGGLVRLEFFDWGIRLRATGRLWQRLIPRWEARYEDLATVQLIQTIGGYGVRVESSARAGALVFWTGRYEEIMDRLADHEVPVDRKGKSLKRAGGLARRTG
jgi:hypothetical protein